MTEKCSSCEQMKKENKQLRKNRDEAVTLLVETANENLALRRQIQQYRKRLYGENCLNPSCTLCIQDDPKTWSHA